MIKNVAVLVAALLLPGCHRASTENANAYQGVVELDEWVLGFEVPGRIRELTAIRGKPVAAGERIAALDTDLATTVRSARESDVQAAESQLALLKAGVRSEDLRSMEAQVRAARASEELLKKNLEREKALLARNASTEAAVEDISGRLERAVAERQSLEQKLAGLRRGSRTEEVSAASARVQTAAAAVKLEEERLQRHELTAPAAGVVLEVHVKTGEVVGAASPVVTVGDPEHPYADVFVPQGKLSGLKPGVAASIRVDGEPAPFTGAIETIAHKTEFTPKFLFSERERPNLVVRVRVRIADPGQRLHAGVPAFVTFQQGKAP